MFGKRSDQPRTAEDRARAAADRAARRAGRPLPPDAFEHTVRPPDVESREPVEEPVAWEEETPREDEFATPPEPQTDPMADEASPESGGRGRPAGA